MPTDNNQMTDEERLNAFTTGLDNFKPEGFEEENWAKLKEAVVGFHQNDVQQLKINSAKMKEEKQALQTKVNTLETSYADSTKQIETLNQQLKESQPEEQKKFFENQTATLKGVYETKISELSASIKKLESEKAELEKGVLERDVLAEFNKVAGEKDWLGGGREAAQKVALAGIEFTRLNVDGKQTLIDKNTSKDIRTIMNDFCGTELGKSFLRSGTSGGGADGSAANNISGKRLTRAQYDALSPQEQMNKVLDGYQIV